MITEILLVIQVSKEDTFRNVYYRQITNLSDVECTDLLDSNITSNLKEIDSHLYSPSGLIEITPDNQVRLSELLPKNSLYLHINLSMIDGRRVIILTPYPSKVKLSYMEFHEVLSELNLDTLLHKVKREAYSPNLTILQWLKRLNVIKSFRMREMKWDNLNVQNVSYPLDSATMIG